jgi:hypothetical protein
MVTVMLRPYEIYLCECHNFYRHQHKYFVGVKHLRHNASTPHKKSLYANALPSCLCTDKLSLRCEVWAKHYRLMIGAINVNGGGNASPLRDF